MDTLVWTDLLPHGPKADWFDPRSVPEVFALHDQFRLLINQKAQFQAIFPWLPWRVEHQLEAGGRTLFHVNAGRVALNNLGQSINQSHLMASFELRLAEHKLQESLVDSTGTQHQFKGLAGWPGLPRNKKRMPVMSVAASVQAAQ